MRLNQVIKSGKANKIPLAMHLGLHTLHSILFRYLCCCLCLLLSDSACLLFSLPLLPGNPLNQLFSLPPRLLFSFLLCLCYSLSLCLDLVDLGISALSLFVDIHDLHFVQIEGIFLKLRHWDTHSVDVVAIVGVVRRHC